MVYIETVKSDNKDAPKPSYRVYIAAICGLLGPMTKGTVFGWSSPAFDDMSRPDSRPRLVDTDEDDMLKSWIASSITLGAFGGSFLCGFTLHYFGRKKAIIFTGIPFAIGWILIGVATNVPLIIVGRVITGMCCGLVSGAVPTFLIEISTPNIRGFLGASFQVFFVTGILLGYTFGTFLHWNVLALISLIPAVLCSASMFFMPESPIWLMTKYGRGEEVENALLMLRSSDSNIDSELKDLENRASSTKSLFSVALLKKPEFYKPVLISVILMVFQQSSGFAAVTFYTTEIFKDSHSSLKPNFAAIIVAIAMVCATITSSLLNDRLGRRVLLLISGAGHTVSLGLMGFYYYKHPHLDFVAKQTVQDTLNGTLSTAMPAEIDNNFGWVPIMCLVLLVVAYSVGFGPICWMIFAEITPSAAITFVSSIVSATHWTCAFIITKEFDDLQKVINRYGAYWLLTGISIVSILFIFKFVPETKGKSAEQIRQLFARKESADESVDNEKSADKRGVMEMK